MSELQEFIQAMDGEWKVERYELVDDTHLKLHYRSVTHPHIVYSHFPSSDFGDIPPVGTLARLAWVYYTQSKPSITIV